MRKYVVFLFASFLSTLVQGGTLEGVEELLRKASKAVQELNYGGRFTYEFGNTLETLEIVHGVQNGVERERIYHLNGVKREFLRSGRRPDCVSAGGFLLRGGLVSVGGDAVGLAQNYHFYIHGDERIAGRLASVIQAVPKDDYRYGVMLAIDKASSLPLMSMTTSSTKSALERFQFVQLSVGDVDLSKDLIAQDDVHKNLDGGQLPCSRPETAAMSWRAGWLPAGFVLSHAGMDPHQGESVTYTDGIASFTLFIKPVDSIASVKQGVARRGATTALLGMTQKQSQFYSVVFVGEVPINTAQHVVASVSPL